LGDKNPNLVRVQRAGRAVARLWPRAFRHVPHPVGVVWDKIKENPPRERVEREVPAAEEEMRRTWAVESAHELIEALTPAAAASPMGIEASFITPDIQVKLSYDKAQDDVPTDPRHHLWCLEVGSSANRNTTYYLMQLGYDAEGQFTGQFSSLGIMDGSLDLHQATDYGLEERAELYDGLTLSLAELAHAKKDGELRVKNL